MKKFDRLPLKIQERMLQCQVNQGNKKDRNVFRTEIESSRSGGGFDWYETEEGSIAWESVICREKHWEFEMVHLNNNNNFLIKIL